MVLHTKSGDIRIERTDGLLATLSVPGQPDRPVALRRRTVPELLSEELRRLGPRRHLRRHREAVAQDRAGRERLGGQAGEEGRGVSGADVVRSSTDDALAATVAADLVAVLLARQAEGAVPSVVLTGGSVARKIHSALASAGGQVDWSRVELWFGDERFVAADDPERNAGQTDEDLLDHVGVDQSRVHRMRTAPRTRSVTTGSTRRPRPTRPSWAAVAGLGGTEAWFDVVMLGIGPDGHCASLFPGRAEVHADGLAVAVRDSPKPPPERVSLTLPVLDRGTRVWFVAAGAEKADAVARSYAGGDLDLTPSAGPRGRESTVYYVDEASGADLP